MTVGSVFLFVSSIALVGCAASPQTERARLQSIVVCCQKISDIPATSPLATENEFGITYDSPVFDFPSGRSPFVAFRVPEAMRGREFLLRSFIVPFTLRGRAHGYFAPTLTYLDADRKLISTFHDSNPRGEMYGGWGRGVFWSSISIPQSAAYIVIYTSAAQLGEQQTSYVVSPGYLIGPVGGTYVTQGGGMAPLYGYRMATGSVMLSDIRK